MNVGRFLQPPDQPREALQAARRLVTLRRRSAVRGGSAGRRGPEAVHQEVAQAVDDRTAATLTIAGRTASAALAAVGPGPDDTVLIGGAAGGVGVFAVQLARMPEPA